MQLQHLRAFIAVAEAGSLTRAGETLHLSQPAVSSQIKILEQQLGLPLFFRTARGMSLTDAGTILLQHAQDTLSHTDRFIRKASQLRGDVTGTLRLGTMDCGYALKTARIIASITSKHPDINVQLDVYNSGENIRHLLDQKLDLAFAEGPWPDDRLHAQTIGMSRVGVIGPADWQQDLQEASWSKLSEFPWIFQSPHCSYYRLLAKISQKHHLRFEPNIHADACGAILDLVAEGVALSIADLDKAAPLIASNQVFQWHGLETQLPISIVALRSRCDEAIIQTTLKTIKQVHHKPKCKQTQLV